MDAEEPDEHHGRDADDEIERGPLTPSLRPPSRHDGEAAHWLRQSVTLPRPVVAAGVLALVVLAALAVLPGGGGQLAALFARPTPTATAPRIVFPTLIPAPPTPFPTPTLVAPTIGAMPTDCAPSPTGPQVGGFGGNRTIYAAGAGPVWVDGFDGPAAAIALPRDVHGTYTEYGWPVYIALGLKDPFEQAVTLRSSDLRTDAPLWFSLSSDPAAGVTQLMAVDPQQFIDSGGGGAIWWNGLLYLPGAGCYSLQASWAGGGWQITFAAGQ